MFDDYLLLRAILSNFSVLIFIYFLLLVLLSAFFKIQLDLLKQTLENETKVNSEMFQKCQNEIRFELDRQKREQEEANDIFEQQIQTLFNQIRRLRKSDISAER
jgi:hypothetical protein